MTKPPKLRCVGCGSINIVAVDPGHEPTYEHPPGLFGFPDLSQKPVLSEPGAPVVARCRECLFARYPALNRMEAAHA